MTEWRGIRSARTKIIITSHSIKLSRAQSHKGSVAGFLRRSCNRHVMVTSGLDNNNNRTISRDGAKNQHLGLGQFNCHSHVLRFRPVCMGHGAVQWCTLHREDLVSFWLTLETDQWRAVYLLFEVWIMIEALLALVTPDPWPGCGTGWWLPSQGGALHISRHHLGEWEHGDTRGNRETISARQRRF